ncbi:addiction module protein [Belliella sp. DSM 107340]|uniref:Addiction module protein n=1 Tax=Belliella calami TaxID=2923436 RepID=A0ABS9UT71_9BACT|nr:addiction module protein [Belliella calami]MCH7399828.1 addiction module protein [Belliella calami]
MINLQYISDSNGKTTGVFIPIDEWIDLKKKYQGIDQEETEVPQWQKEIVTQRLEAFRSNPSSALDFEDAIDDIEKEL